MSIISDLFLSRHPAIASPFTASIRSFVFSITLSPQSDKNWINKLISGRQQSLAASGKFGCVAQNGTFLYNSTAVRSLSSRVGSSFPFGIIEAELYRQFPLLVAYFDCNSSASRSLGKSFGSRLFPRLSSDKYFHLKYSRFCNALSSTQYSLLMSSTGFAVLLSALPHCRIFS